MKNGIKGFILGILITTIVGVFAGAVYNAKDIVFTPSNNSFDATNVQDAINKLYYIEKGCNVEVGQQYIFDYTGDAQTFSVPCNGTYKIELWGASGSTTNSGTPGLGAYTAGEIDLNQGTNLYVYVGEVGNLTSANYNIMTFNGGGYNHGSSSYYGRGGGATDVRLVNGNWSTFDSLKSRIMVAGAGGSGGYSNSGSLLYSTGGAAGGLYSYKGNGVATTWTIATQTSGYAFGYGGPGLSGQSYSGSGSGYYGGGSSTVSPCDVTTGGSSFISGHDGCDAVAESSTSTNIIHTGQSVHYSGYQFRNTVMIDGNGYNWTNVVGTIKVGMPTHDGTSTMIGNTGNGYAKITLVSVD